MFGFSSLSCYSCFYLDRESVKDGTGWCNEKRKWINLSGCACNDYEELFYVATFCMEDTRKLRTLINFRESYMRNNEKGKEFLDEYRAIGPILVEKIKKDMYKVDVVEDLNENYLLPMYDFVKNNRYDEAEDTFIQMIGKLKNRYGFEEMRKEKQKTLIKF